MISGRFRVMSYHFDDKDTFLTWIKMCYFRTHQTRGGYGLPSTGLPAPKAFVDRNSLV